MESMEVCRSTSPMHVCIYIYIYILFFCSFCIFLLIMRYFSAYILQICSYSTFPLSIVHEAEKTIIFVLWLFLFSCRCSLWFPREILLTHDFSRFSEVPMFPCCFTCFPLRSEESFIIFSLAKLKQEKQRKRTEFRCARRALN